MLQGKWTYRSYLNGPSLVGDDPRKALAMIFGDGVFDFLPDEAGLYRGTLDMGGGYVLNPTAAELLPADEGAPIEVSIVGLGIGGTPHRRLACTATDGPRGSTRSPASSARWCG
jgi:hypothetical protein